MSHLRRSPKELVAQERYIYHAELEQCPVCQQPLQLSAYYHSRKTVQQLDKVVYVASRPKFCTNAECTAPGQPYLSARAQSVALRYCSYGLDVVAQIGWWRDQERLNGDEIYRRLQGQVQIGRREVDVLLHQYRLLLACAESQRAELLVQAAAQYGGLILHLDGLEPEGARCIADQPVSDPWLLTFRQHLLSLSERYWAGLFRCYDIVGLPRTNNELEGLYGQTKRQTRRQSGLRQMRQPLQRHGAWLLHRSQDPSSRELHARLVQVSPEVYRAERARWQARQAQFRQRHRWRHDRTAFLAQPESAWAAVGPDSS